MLGTARSGSAGGASKIRARLVYTCHQRSYSRRLLERLIGGGCLCLSGGGNFGDLYPAHQAFRERVLSDFPHHDIIQLPQTVCFSEFHSIRRAKEVLQRHPRFTLMVRDRPSLEVARHELAVPTLLCPDMAFGLTSPGRHRRPELDVIGLCRTDFEGSGVLAGLADQQIPVEDWIQDAPSFIRQVAERGERVVAAHPRSLGWARAGSALFFDSMARGRLERGMRILERARVVITDRLHGHILCVLAGIPHVIVDTRFGKMRAFHEAWTAGSPLVRAADSTEMAVKLARELAAAEDL
jgi:pyruvyl transferase EpsO